MYEAVLGCGHDLEAPLGHDLRDRRLQRAAERHRLAVLRVDPVQLLEPQHERGAPWVYAAGGGCFASAELVAAARVDADDGHATSEVLRAIQRSCAESAVSSPRYDAATFSVRKTASSAVVQASAKRPRSLASAMLVAAVYRPSRASLASLSKTSRASWSTSASAEVMRSIIVSLLSVVP